MPRIVWALSALCLAILLVAPGCSKPVEPIRQPAAKPTGVAIGVSLAGLDTPRRVQLKADIEAAAAKHPDLRLLVRDAGDNAKQQTKYIEEFVRESAAAIIVCPVDSQELTEPLAKVFDQGVPVVVLDRAIIGDRFSCSIAADWKRAGAAAGEWLAGALRGKGKIVEIEGPVDSPEAGELHEAFRAALRHPGYHFVFNEHVDPKKRDAAKLMGEALTRLRQIDAVFAYDEVAAMEAYQTAKASNRDKGVLFLGIGCAPIPSLAQATRHGASLLVPTGGAEAVDAVVKLLHGEKPPKRIVPEIKVLTRH